MYFLTEHVTESEFNQVKDNLLLPNVALIDETFQVNYLPDPYAGHAYVEIGGLKWATMNIGATAVTDTGLYFQWGDTQGYTTSQVGTDKIFDWAHYKFNPSGDGSTFTKYNSSDNKKVLDLEDDAVRANWGGKWRMPTNNEYGALLNAVNSALTTNYNGSGVSGLVLTDKTDSSKELFFPAVGGCGGSSTYLVGSLGYYWSSSALTYNVSNALGLNFENGSVFVLNRSRYSGFVLRGIVNPE